MQNAVCFRIFWLITILTLLSGCSGYRHYQFPAEYASQENAGAQDKNEMGATVRVTMKSGEINEGVLQAIEPVFVEVLLPAGEGMIQTYYAKDVQTLEIYKEVSILVPLGITSFIVGCLVYYFSEVHEGYIELDCCNEAENLSI